jgi:UDP-N-acetylglucosamine--N-acetylmuramyl-(pentapeptide) pyrophosphoryl-undecaprenol N-acetylglucosamine transferase
MKEWKGYEHFNLDPKKRTILMLGGSLGAATLNKSIVSALDKLRKDENVQVLWQCGKYYFKDMQKLQTEGKIPHNIHLMDFISRMDYAYSVADLIISRAGAGSISEFSLLGKAVILVPSPNVAEDHQTKNAQALVNKEAAVMISDALAPKLLFDFALEMVRNDDELKKLSENIIQMAQHNSAERIVDEIEKLI